MGATPSTRLPTAVVVGLESMAGLQNARLLRRRGVPVIGVGRDPSLPFCRTNTCDRIVYAQQGGLVDALIEVGSSLTEPGVIIPSNDGEVLQIGARRDELTPYYRLRLPSKELIEGLMDKQSFATFARAHGLPAPATALIDGRRDAEVAATTLRFPVVMKPALRDPRWSAYTKVKAFKTEDSEEFLAVYDAVAGWADRFVAQEWIQGGDDNLVTCNAYFDPNSEPLVTFVSRKLRQWPPETGMGSLAEEYRSDEVRDATVELFQKARFVGLAYLEMKRDDRDGRYYMTEANVGRTTGRSALAEAAGVELVMTAYCDALGLPLPERRSQGDGDMKWIYLRWDLQSAFAGLRSGDLTLREWVRSLRGPKAFAIFDRKDPLPFVLDYWATIERGLRRRGNGAAAAGAPSTRGSEEPSTKAGTGEAGPG